MTSSGHSARNAAGCSISRRGRPSGIASPANRCRRAIPRTTTTRPDVPIHPTAVVDPRATIDPSAEVGPFAVIDGPVEVGARTRLMAHTVLLGRTILGDDNVVHPGAVLGGAPQDLKYTDAPTGVRIGHRNVFREHAVVNRGTAAE